MSPFIYEEDMDEFCTDLLRFAMDHNYRPEVEWKRFKTKLSSFDVRHLVWSIALNKLQNKSIFSCSDRFCIALEALSSLILPEGVISIGDRAFESCNLTSIYISSTVSTIANFAFEPTAQSIVVSDENPVFDSRNNCNAIIDKENNTLLFGCRNTTIPASVTSIGDYALLNCGFTSITTDLSQAGEGTLFLPSSVTSIGNYVFDGSLTTVILPESVVELGDNTLGGGVTSLTCTRTQPFTLVNPDMIGVSAGCVLHIPAGTRSAYIAAGWTEEVFGGGIVEDGEAAPDFVSVSLSSAGAGTYCSKYDLDFSGTDDVKAYIVSAFLPRTGEATLTRIKYVPAFTGIVLLGGEGSYDIPVTDEQTVVANLLAGVTVRTQLNKVSGKYMNFILSNGVNGLGFYAVNDGSILSANRAYLPLPTASLPSSAGVKGVSIRFDEGDGVDTTAISSEDESPTLYDLSGRRVILSDTKHLPKGIYIVNGKKVMK
ncbi:MAG: leucine-rich repeat domain-containing protein [Bacteroidaceae bacterium]|nr:leucine-rich repeat domain-containing protein [Bacteroidaceae bacterium]